MSTDGGLGAVDGPDTEAARANSVPAAALPTVVGFPRRESPAYLVAKRILDILGATAGILLCIPLWMIAGVLIKLDSPGGVFHVQQRVGEGGRPFRFYKLRTMYLDAEKRLEELRAHNEMSGPVFKIRRDPRITRVGRWLRRFSLDETPQLIHVLLGQMSLVGPRPPLLEEVLRYEPWMTERLSVRPGLTCIWQVEGRNEVPFEKWVEMDIYYIRNRNFWMDLRLLLRTIAAVLIGRGAY
ncbi:MAG: sugar transferase [Armatimonadetes bacterium]|nr:sugar transferase [Armatimonadota bacterium]